MMLNRLLHACETELIDIDKVINFKKSSCIRIGPRNDATCASIISLNDHVIHWMTEVRYLLIYMVSSRVFKCSLHYAKCGFYRAANAIFTARCYASAVLAMALCYGKSVYQI